MRQRIRLTESDLHRIIKESVKKVLNEVKFNGVSYHGTNPYDWKDLADIRNKMLNPDNEESFNKNYGKMKRNKNNAKELGWKGRNDTRLSKAQEYYNTAEKSQDPKEREKYNKLAKDTLGDIDGRTKQNLDMIENPSKYQEYFNK